MKHAKNNAVEASTLRPGEVIQIPGYEGTRKVIANSGSFIDLQDEDGEPSFLESRRFVFLIQEKALTPSRPISSHSMTTHLVRRSFLELDPRLASVPMMGAVADHFRAGTKPQTKKVGQEISDEKDALWANLDEQGIIEPLKAWRKGRRFIICDGRHRLEWSDARKKTKVPVIEVTKEQAAAIVEATVIGRRHWTKGQRAYLGVTLHPQVAQAGAHRPEKNSDSVGVIATATELAKRLGISADTVSQACELYRAFFAPGCKSGSPEAIEAASLKEKYEMLIWSGHGLGAIIAGIGGGQSTEGKPRPDSGFHGLDKPLGTFTRFSSLFTNWTPEEQGKAQQLMTAKFRTMSPEFRLALSESLAAAEI
ncbi:MAG TPA: ParB N-terminal domain-containing protein [Prosthecobacter sp.]